MKPEFVKGHVRASCPDCGTPTTFEFQSAADGEFGTIVTTPRLARGDERVIYKLLRCSVCSRAGVAKVACASSYTAGQLEWFWPRSLPHQPLPKATPRELVLEVLEAEKCMSVNAWRPAAAMCRSALEKTLNANGYTKGVLKQKIDSAAADGVITAARQQRAQEMIRTLGNDVLHDAWREVSEEEVQLAHEYVARVIHDFYDDRATVETLLRGKNRLP